jgi:hypothetical protein
MKELPSWRRAILEKLILVHLIKKCCAFMDLEGPLLFHKTPPLLLILIQKNKTATLITH